MSKAYHHMIQNAQLVWDDEQIQIVFVGIFLVIFPFTFTIEPRMDNTFWACSLLLFIHIFFHWPFLDPHLTTHHSNICVHILEMFDEHWSTIHPLLVTLVRQWI